MCCELITRKRASQDREGVVEVQQAMAKWNQVKNNNVSPVYMVLSSSGPQLNTVDYRGSLQSYVAYCDINHSSTEIFQVNISLNTTYYNFGQGAIPGCYDVQSIVMHELGHGLGI